MSETPVGPDDVRHVARLARVHLDDEEVEAYAEQFAEVLEHFDALDEVPETETKPELVNVLRADEVGECLSQAAALANAPDAEDGFFKGPPVS